MSDYTVDPDGDDTPPGHVSPAEPVEEPTEEPDNEDD